MQSIYRTAQDLQQAMDVTENAASKTIQHLEMQVARLQDSLDKVEIMLRDEQQTDDSRIHQALEIIAEP
jgi:hypothetical protein